MGYEIIDAPQDLEHLVLYEIATKSFNAPGGPETGTFASVEQKLPYLKELGINGIWLIGHQLCQNSHFYNIWTEYACIRPDRLDPSLGTEDEFKHMVASAHAYGIKVFLDVITHGVMTDSDLVQEHPDWFKGGSWGMRDFDWYGGKKELDQWWVETWLWYVIEFGIDGFRLDVSHYRNDLWALIRRKAADAGKRIITIAEMGPAIKGVVDILQHGEVISHNYGLNRSSRLLYDVAGCCMDRQSRVGERYDVKIFYQDGTVQDSKENTWYQNDKVPEVIWEGAEIRHVECEEYQSAYQMQLGRLRVENIFGEKEIRNIQIFDKQGQEWNSDISEALEVDYTIEFFKKQNGLVLVFPLRIQEGQFLSIQLSCHDNGWEDFPEGENPYGAQGSRYLAGYTTLLAPGVPVFMSGEEFNADFRPIPWLSPNLFGGGSIGTGRWLYGSWLEWEQLKIPEKAETLEDFQLMLRIWQKHSDVIKAYRMGEKTRSYGQLAFDSKEELPIPYYYKGDRKAIVVAANPYRDKDLVLRLHLEDILEEGGQWEAEVLFGPESEKGIFVAPVQELADKEWKIRRDHVRQGGILVIQFERKLEKTEACREKLLK